jgi:hypothetical protein
LLWKAMKKIDSYCRKCIPSTQKIYSINRTYCL